MIVVFPDHTHLLFLKPNIVEVFTVFSKLLNLTNEKETKDISDAMEYCGLIVCH